MKMLSLGLLLTVCLYTTTTTTRPSFVVSAFVPEVYQSKPWKSMKLEASSLQEPPPSPETIRHDIEEMKKEALARFEKLAEQMEELKEIKLREKEAGIVNKSSSTTKRTATTSASSNVPTTTSKTTATTSTSQLPNSLDSLEGDISRQYEDLLQEEDKVKNKKKDSHLFELEKNEIKEDNESDRVAVQKAAATNTVVKSTPAPVAKFVKPHTLDLLDDTRWKIVFNIGREAGTWMPPDWGVSGDRLLLQVVVDFATEPVYDQDEFFQGIAGTKRLDVVEAFLIPRGVGDHSVGRRPVPCKPTGGYKVCRGQGPMGTDLVRLYIELTDDVYMLDHESDVYCPKGRVYATCGYFMIHDSRETGVALMKSPKEIAQEEYHKALTKCDQLQLQLDADSRLFSIEKFQLMKDLYVAKKDADIKAKELQALRQREPDKSQLRLSRKRDVGLTKDGGVCCKVQKGMTLEYHILGRMEIGCVDDHKGSSAINQQQNMSQLDNEAKKSLHNNQFQKHGMSE